MNVTLIAVSTSQPILRLSKVVRQKQRKQTYGSVSPQTWQEFTAGADSEAGERKGDNEVVEIVVKLSKVFEEKIVVRLGERCYRTTGASSRRRLRKPLRLQIVFTSA
jgi:hypothetical protein